LYRASAFYFALALLIAIAGFYPTYFSVLAKTDAAHHFHGVTATLWMGLLIVQAGLYRAGKLALHRKMGRLSLVLVPLFLVSGAGVVRTMLVNRGGFSQAYGARLAFVDLLSLGCFALAFALALVHRRNLHLHARYMATTALLVLPPALGRLLPMLSTRIQTFDLAFHSSYLITELMVAWLLLQDLRSQRSLRPCALLLTVLALQQLGFVLLPHLG